MAEIQKPQSDKARLSLLSDSKETQEQEVARGKSYLSRSTVGAIHTFLPEYESAINDVNTKMGQRSQEVTEKNESMNVLKTYVRDGWEVTKRRITRQNEPANVYTYYHLSINGMVPKPASNTDWLKMAAAVIEGDAKAVTKGFPAMINPSAEELALALEKARKEKSDVAMADRDYDESQAAVEKLRTKADELIQDVLDELRFNLRKLDDSSARRIMRSYGVTYKYLPGEPVDEIVDETIQN